MNFCTEEGYHACLAKIEELMDAEFGTPEHEWLMELVWMVEQYEKENYPIPPPSLWGRFCYWWENKRHWWQR